MGLSSKHVSSDHGLGWNQGNLDLQKASSLKRQSSHHHQQEQEKQQSEPLKCPRCDSTNTKFCYYNNYNKSQPRHFCKACKRHWTKGGTLRNVPVGGGRKNKRLKTTTTAKAASKTTTTTTTTTTTPTLFGGSSTTTTQAQHPRLGLPLATLGSDHKNFSEAFYQTLGRQPTSSFPEINPIINNGLFLSSTLSLLPNGQDPEFPYSNLGIFESNPCSISSNQSPNLYNNYIGGEGEANGLEETGMNSLNTSMSSSSLSDNNHYQPWEIPAARSDEVMNFSSNWGWDDFEKFVSVEADLTIPWDEREIKP